MDSYISVLKSLEHSVMSCHHKLNLVVVEASQLEDPTLAPSKTDYDQAWNKVRTADGILVPGGFGVRGTEGMIAAAQWARENKTPYLGICLGMQTAVIEFARHVCNITEAGSIELSPDCSDQLSSKKEATGLGCGNYELMRKSSVSAIVIDMKLTPSTSNVLVQQAFISLVETKTGFAWKYSSSKIILGM